MPKPPKITVAIPTYNREIELINAIDDVLNKQTFKDLELIVVDQSVNHTPEVVNALKEINDARLRYFKTSPPSLTIARNFALSHSNSPYIVFLDDDVVLDKNLIKEFYETFQAKPEISAVAGRVMQKGFPIEKDVLRFDKYAVSHGVFTATQPGYTNAFPGGNNALKIEDVIKVGGFDTRYKKTAFREESDLSMRLFKAGYKIFYNPKAELLHLAAHYGGTRAKTHIYDNPSFYSNELFFTIRMAERGYKIKALRLKYREYCLSVRHFNSYKRRYYFFTGLVIAVLRIIFIKSSFQKEVI
jgi:GT2 family glycosyltransferase